MLKIKWADRITNEVFQRAKEERLFLKILKIRRHSWIGRTIGHNEFVVNILGGAIFGKKTTASNVPIVAPNVITSLSLTGNRDWVLCIEYEVFI